MDAREGAPTPELDEAIARVEADMPRRKPVQPQVREFLRIKVISMGEGGSGKTCLIKRYCEQRFVAKYISTIGVDFGVKTVKMEGLDVKVNFWDLSGQPEFVDVRNEFYKDAQGAILVYDVGNRRTFDALDSWMKEARKYGAKNAVIALCANKMDLGKKRAVSEKEGKGYALANEMEYFETSASSGDNVDEALHHVFRGVVAEHLQRELPPPVE